MHFKNYRKGGTEGRIIFGTENSCAQARPGTCYAANLTHTFQRFSLHFTDILHDRIYRSEVRDYARHGRGSVGVAELSGQGVQETGASLGQPFLFFTFYFLICGRVSLTRRNR